MRKRRRYMVIKGGEVVTIRELGTWHYAMFDGKTRLPNTWFGADTRDQADAYAAAWAKKRGYKAMRIKR